MSTFEERIELECCFDVILDCKYLSLRNVVAEMWDEIEVEPSTQSKVAEGGTKATSSACTSNVYFKL